jgi:hypothetical protein
MRAMARHILAFCLTIALISGGMPFAHAMRGPAMLDAQTHWHDAGHAMHHQVQHDVASDHQSETAPGKTARDLCKGLKCCSMCATAYVAPVFRDMTIERVAFTVRYGMPVIAWSQAMTFIDPGIPIA